MDKNDEGAAADFSLYVIEQTKPGDVIPHNVVEKKLSAKRGTASFRRRLVAARRMLLNENVEIDGYGAAKGVGIRRLAPQELVHKTGQRLRSTSRAAKRTLKTCSVACAVVKSNSDIRLIAARAAIASSVIAQTSARNVALEAEKDHAPPLSPREIWKMREGSKR